MGPGGKKRGCGFDSRGKMVECNLNLNEKNDSQVEQTAIQTFGLTFNYKCVFELQIFVLFTNNFFRINPRELCLRGLPVNKTCKCLIVAGGLERVNSPNLQQ